MKNSFLTYHLPNLKSNSGKLLEVLLPARCVKVVGCLFVIEPDTIVKGNFNSGRFEVGKMAIIYNDKAITSSYSLYYYCPIYNDNRYNRRRFQWQNYVQYNFGLNLNLTDSLDFNIENNNNGKIQFIYNEAQSLSETFQRIVDNGEYSARVILKIIER